MSDLDSTPEEIWKPIPNELLGFYEVSSFGRVRRMVPGPHTRIGRISKQRVTQFKYLQVCTSVKDRHRYWAVHRLVAMAFLGLPSIKDKIQVNHKDGNKMNNRPDNLEWVSPKENMQHAVRTGLMWSIGERHWKRRMMGSDVTRIRKLYETGLITMDELARAFNMRERGRVWEIVHRKSWKSVP